MAVSNSLITLILLLIAPLGLASVIFNTICVGLITFGIATGFDLVLVWLLRGTGGNPLNQVNRRVINSPYSSVGSEIEKLEQHREE